ncbi:gem-associated protein 5 isoform X2 [Athalia rosae]|nr:gem-associated protein 5 isoform X2 [Athalia rosae]
MNEATLPPSPNWYLGNILACAKDGTVAWGARNAIVIAVSEQDKKTLNYSILPDAHIDRVTSLAFSPRFGEPDQSLLVSGGDENVVRIWDLCSKSAVMAHYYAEIHQKVVGVDWSKADPNIVCCISTDGFLVIWNIALNIAHQISLGKLTATCILCCPHDPDLVAIGTKSGLIYIVNIHGNGKIVYKLRGHDTEITSLSWCPVDTNIITGTDTKDLLLASGGKDRSIFIWRAGSDGRYQIELTLPNMPLNSHQHRSKMGWNTGNWTAVCWITPKLLLSSLSWGELISWDLTANSKSKPVCKLIHGYHVRGPSCIAGLQTATGAEQSNWRSKDSQSITVWTLAQDRWVVCCTIKGTDVKMTYNIPTQGGYTYCIAPSPLDTSRVAFGVGDAMLRLWNLCEPHENTFDVTVLWQKIKGKIMAVSWHPEKENIIAFGTSEGRVGVFDTNSPNKPPILYRNYHRHTLYALGWGPHPTRKTDHVLYSCGDGELVYYDPEKPNGVPTSVIKKNCTEFAWKQDGSCLAVGFENGAVSFLNRNLVSWGSVIYSLKRAVQRLVWHPESTATDLSLSPLRHQLAVATNSPTITILEFIEPAEDCSTIDGSDKTADDKPSHKIVATLDGHSAKVVALAWNPHISGYLASASYDNRVQVWKIETKELVGTYTGHYGPVHCCIWSPFDPDLIITGSADFTVRIWRLSKQKVMMPTENSVKPKKVRTKKKKTKANKTTDLTSDPEQITNGQDDNAIDVGNVGSAPTDKEIKRSLTTNQINRKKGKQATYFTVLTNSTGSKESKLKSVMEMVGISCQKSNIEQDLVTAEEANDVASSETQNKEISNGLSIFGSKENVLNLLEIEKSAHTKTGHYDTVVEMDLWSNNLKQSLQDATKRGQLNDFLVSLAPSLSFRVWQEMCETYAKQLESEGNYRKAASYFLCIHKIERAIQVFVDAKMLREAYVLARCKLAESDPIIDSLLETWAIHTTTKGQFEDAALCYIKLGNLKEAAKLLGRRNDIRSLEVATQLALKSGDDEFGLELAERAVTEALLKADYTAAEQLIESFPQIQHCEVKVAALKEMDRIFQNCDNQSIWNCLQGNATECILKNLSNQYSNCNKYYYAKLLKNSENLQISENERTVWVKICGQIALATVCVELEKKLHHLVTALEIIYRFEAAKHLQRGESETDSKEGQRNLMTKLLSQLNSILNIKSTGLGKSLRAFWCYGVLNWLLDSDLQQAELEGKRELVASFIEDTIDDALDKQAVRHKVLSAEINKLEGLLVLNMGKLQKVGEMNGHSEKDIGNHMERLAEIRREKEKFHTERLYTPNPVMVYSKAQEVISIVFEGEIEEKIKQLVTRAWTEATS